GITASNVAHLKRRVVRLDGTLDSSPIYLRGIGGKDVVVVTPTYRPTEALNPNTRAPVWRHPPPRHPPLARTPPIPHATPVPRSARRFVSAAAPDGRITKLALANGSVAWSTPITRDPTHEKLTSSLNIVGGVVYATTGGYIGDAPPYQGHVVALDAGSGKI